MGGRCADAEQEEAGGEVPGSWGVPSLGQATVADGVRLIAGGIENVLQRFRLQVVCSLPYTFCQASLRQCSAMPGSAPPALPCPGAAASRQGVCHAH